MHKRETKINKFLGQRLNAVGPSLLSLRGVEIVSRPHLKHDFNLSFFPHHVGKNFLADMREFDASDFPKPSRLFGVFGGLSMCVLDNQPTKSGEKIINKGFVGIDHLNEVGKISGTRGFIRRVSADVNAAFAFNNSSQKRILKFSGDLHKSSKIVNDASIIQHCLLNVQPERLRRVESCNRISDSLNSVETSREGINKTLRHRKMVHKTRSVLSNSGIIQDQDPVLSWVTERLGVAMR